MSIKALRDVIEATREETVQEIKEYWVNRTVELCKKTDTRMANLDVKILSDHMAEKLIFTLVVRVELEDVPKKGGKFEWDEGDINTQ